MQSRFTRWGDARVFLAVAREGSTLKASKALGMTQTTVARRIEALEHALGLVLFERDTRGFRLTPAGEGLVPPAEAIEAAVAAFLTRADAARRPDAIRITAPSIVFNAELAQVISDYSRDNGGVRFEFMPAEHKVDLIAGEADVAFRFGPRPDHPDLILRPIMRVELALFASEDYVARHGKPEAPEDITGHDVLLFSQSLGPSSINAWLEGIADPARVVGRSAEMYSMRSAIQSGLGIGPLTVQFARQAGLVQCLPPREEFYSEGWLVIAPDAWRHEEVKAFARFIVPELRRMWGG